MFFLRSGNCENPFRFYFNYLSLVDFSFIALESMQLLANCQPFFAFMFQIGALRNYLFHSIILQRPGNQTWLTISDNSNYKEWVHHLFSSLLHVFLNKKTTFFAWASIFLNITLEIRLDFLNIFVNFYLFVFINYLLN